MALVHFTDDNGDDEVLDLAPPDDDANEPGQYGTDPFEILADQESRVGTPLYWQTNRSPG